MGKNNKKQNKKPLKDAASAVAVAESKSKVSLADELNAMSSDEGSVPPEDQWDDAAKELRDSLMSGKFDHLLEREDGDASSVEEVDLDDDDDSDGMAQPTKKGKDDEEAEMRSSDDDDEEEEEDDDVDVDVDEEVSGDEEEGETSHGHGQKLVNDENVAADEDASSDEDEDPEAEEAHEDEESAKVDRTLDEKNHINSKALHVVTDELAMQKKGWSWAETFDIVPQTPLPFDKKRNPEDHIDIHDDLKREVTFYDIALEAVNEARIQCKEHDIPFARPDDFFAEMVKTDDHMAKIKDRLIFENKKIEAVVMRKTNKEQKLRVKESQANRAAEKSKRKRDHFKSLDDWQSSGAAGGRNDSALMDALEGKGPNKKRMSADKKYGFGGQKPRFKQNDKQSLNDSSSFNPRGNFPGGMKKRSALGAAKGGGGSGHRPGKRARDSKRTKA